VSTLGLHELTHSDERRFICQVCPKKLPSYPIYVDMNYSTQVNIDFYVSSATRNLHKRHPCIHMRSFTLAKVGLRVEDVTKNLSMYRCYVDISGISEDKDVKKAR